MYLLSRYKALGSIPISTNEDLHNADERELQIHKCLKSGSICVPHLVPAQLLAEDSVDTKVRCAQAHRESVEVSWDTGFLGHQTVVRPSHSSNSRGVAYWRYKNLCLMGPGETAGLAGKVFATQVWGL